MFALAAIAGLAFWGVRSASDSAEPDPGLILSKPELLDGTLSVVVDTRGLDKSVPGVIVSVHSQDEDKLPQSLEVKGTGFRKRIEFPVPASEGEEETFTASAYSPDGRVVAARPVPLR